MMVTCGKCGVQLDAGDRFCAQCGTAAPRSAPIDLPCPTCHASNLPGEAHCEACGAALPPAPYLVIAATGQRVPLDLQAASVVVGRADVFTGVHPDLDLGPFGAAAAGVSRRHVRLSLDETTYRIEDLNSVNLTYVNQQRLLPEHPMVLANGALLRLGRLDVTFHSGEDHAAAR